MALVKLVDTNPGNVPIPETNIVFTYEKEGSKYTFIAYFSKSHHKKWMKLINGDDVVIDFYDLRGILERKDNRLIFTSNASTAAWPDGNSRFECDVSLFIDQLRPLIEKST